MPTNSGQKHVEPSSGLTAFNCPHCGALAKQFWWSVHADNLQKDDTPFLVDRDQGNIDRSKFPEDRRDEFTRWADRMATGLPYFEKDSKGYTIQKVSNLHISNCYNCDSIAIWLYDRMLWPVRGNAPEANFDLPMDIRADYEEAATIVDLSPRGAAALLRLAVQKLCIFLGGKGKDINADIAALVEDGLDARVQKALDVVRVIGNNAVHPGVIDLKDDRATAAKLFSLINIIAEIMISQPKHISTMFDDLPANAKAAIAKRDKK